MAGIYPVVSVIVPYTRGPSSEETYVMVQEKDSKLWNQPGGEVNFADGNWLDAATREVREESGLTICLKGFVGVYCFSSKRGSRILCNSFLAEVINGALRTSSEDIVDVRAMTLEEIRKLNGEKKLRSDSANVKPLEDYLRSGAFSIDAVFYVC